MLGNGVPPLELLAAVRQHLQREIMTQRFTSNREEAGAFSFAAGPMRSQPSADSHHPAQSIHHPPRLTHSTPQWSQSRGSCRTSCCSTWAVRQHKGQMQLGLIAAYACLSPVELSTLPPPACSYSNRQRLYLLAITFLPTTYIRRLTCWSAPPQHPPASPPRCTCSRA